jgi:hypothetical protein
VDDSADSGIACRQSENAHIETGGMSRKEDHTKIVPLCAWHHTQSIATSLHARGKRGFNRYHGVDLDRLAALTEARWQTYLTETTHAR